MFPMVPYHALPALHQEMLKDCPKPYSGFWDAYREIIPTLWRQLRDPGHFVHRQLPPGAGVPRPGPLARELGFAPDAPLRAAE